MLVSWCWCSAFPPHCNVRASTLGFCMQQLLNVPEGAHGSKLGEKHASGSLTHRPRLQSQPSPSRTGSGPQSSSSSGKLPPMPSPRRYMEALTSGSHMVRARNVKGAHHAASPSFPLSISPPLQRSLGTQLSKLPSMGPRGDSGDSATSPKPAAGKSSREIRYVMGLLHAGSHISLPVNKIQYNGTRPTLSSPALLL